MRAKRQTQILRCWKQRRTLAGSDGWRFPDEVEKLLIAETKGDSVLQLFGGKSSWGVRMDIDVIVRPDVIADAWAPPFGRDSFDTVIIDPPYTYLNSYMKSALFQSAGWIARRRVFWFHTVVQHSLKPLKLEREWIVMLRSGVLRILQEFSVRTDKREPAPFIGRGPGMKYNRWRAGEVPLPFHQAGER